MSMPVCKFPLANSLSRHSFFFPRNCMLFIIKQTMQQFFFSKPWWGTLDVTARDSLNMFFCNMLWSISSWSSSYKYKDLAQCKSFNPYPLTIHYEWWMLRLAADQTRYGPLWLQFFHGGREKRGVGAALSCWLGCSHAHMLQVPCIWLIEKNTYEADSTIFKSISRLNIL